MEQFTGIKTVLVCKMSRKTAEEIIGRKVRPDSDEIEDEGGYLVQYPDGYRSWSPLKVFEESYANLATFRDSVEARWLGWNGKVKELQIEEKVKELQIEEKEKELAYYKEKVVETEKEIKELKML